MSIHLYTYENPCSERDLDRVLSIIESGGIIAYPTDLNWAFACDCENIKAIDRLRMFKPHKEKSQPFSLLCSDIAMAAKYCNIDSLNYALLRKNLPGPYTILLERNRGIARQLKDKRRVMGIRIPDRPLMIELVSRLNRPLATTSVPPGEDGFALKFGYQVVQIYGHGLDLILDLGEELPGEETTIIDLSEGIPQLIREGRGDPEKFLSSIFSVNK